jgi:TetR/AcrR family fatty acid metabolism transcriptional regulator
MARPVDRDAKRLKILKAAAGRFGTVGYEAASMDGVAAAAGVSKGSLYDYFQNKEDLFYAVFEWFEEHVLRLSMERMASAGGSARARFAAFADASISAVMDNVELFPVSLEVWAAAAKRGTRARFSEALQKLYALFRTQVTALLREAQASGEIKPDVDAEAVAALVVGAVDGLLLQYWIDPKIDPRRWMNNFVAALFDGIGSETKGSR